MIAVPCRNTISFTGIIVPHRQRVVPHRQRVVSHRQRVVSHRGRSGM